MAINHEVQFVDFDPNAGVLAGEAAPQELLPAAEAVGAIAVAPGALYFAEKTPSQIAQEQLDAEGAPDPHQQRVQAAARKTTRQTVEARRATAEKDKQ